MVTRNSNPKKNAPEPAPRTGGESSAVPGKDFEAPGDGTVTTPLGRRDHHGNRPSRNVALEGDKMQSLVGGGPVETHQYRDDPTQPDAEENRR